jgi:hypothetical protein
VFDYVDGAGWVLISGYVNLIPQANTATATGYTEFCSHTVERTGVYQLGGSFTGQFLQDPTTNGKAVLAVTVGPIVGGTVVSTGIDTILGTSTIGDGLGMTTGTVAINVNAGDTVRVSVKLETPELTLTASGVAKLSINAVK